MDTLDTIDDAAAATAFRRGRQCQASDAAASDAAASDRALRRMTCGGWPKARTNARRILFRSAKPVRSAIVSIGCKVLSIISEESGVAVHVQLPVPVGAGFGAELDVRASLFAHAGYATETSHDVNGS